MKESLIHIPTNSAGIDTKEAIIVESDKRGVKYSLIASKVITYSVNHQASFSDPLEFPREKGGTQMSIRVPVETKEEIVEWARSKGTTQSKLCNYIIETALEKKWIDLALEYNSSNQPENKMISERNNSTNNKSKSSVKKDSIFICYAHEDSNWLQKMKPFLKKLANYNIIIWSDELIRPGKDWKKAIKSELKKCSAAVLIISQDFLVSDFILNEELPEIIDSEIEDSKGIFGLVVKNCTIEMDEAINKYQMLNPIDQPLEDMEENKQNRYFVRLFKEILSFIQKDDNK